MKKILLTLLTILVVAQISAQSLETKPDPNTPYLKDKNLPAFKLNLIDGSEVTHKTIPKFKYTCIIFFSPDCSHCENEAATINKYKDKLKNVLFIWDSYRDMIAIQAFADKFNMVGQPNVLIGRDPAYMIPSFFRPKMTPFVALYKNNQLVKVYEKGADIFDLIKIIESK
jgi:thioredoxin-related protein